MRPIDQLWTEAGTIWQHRNEFLPFCQWLRNAGIKSVLEIGTGFGGSAYVFGEITDHGRVVTVDFNQTGAARIDPQRRRPQANVNFVQITGDSRTDLTESRVAEHGPFDLVYFDTEHAYEDCVDNWTRYAPMATRFIAQHDINMDEVNWPDAGIPRIWREKTAGLLSGVDFVEFINPAPDPRFPRWGGLGILKVTVR